MNETQSAGEGSHVESGTWITYESKLSSLEEPNIEHPNLKNLEVEDDISANDAGRIFVSTIDTDNVKSKIQGKEDVPENHKQLTLLNLDGVETSMNAQDAQVEWSLLCAGGVARTFSLMHPVFSWCVAHGILHKS